MAGLDENGLGLLWQRIRTLFARPFAGIAGQANRLVVTDDGGNLSVMEALRTNITEETIFETAATDPSEMFDLGMDGMSLLIIIPEDDPGEQLGGMESVTLAVDGAGELLLRRHYGDGVAEDSCIVFGNTRYTGFGTPACQGQADTGEKYMVFYMDGMLGICLPEDGVHSLWLGNRNACLSMDGSPAADSDLVNLVYYREHMPAVEGAGGGSLMQNLVGAAADGTGSFAGNLGKATGRYAFAACSGEAGGEYASALGVHTSAGGRGAFAVGYETTAAGVGAVAAGDSCRADGKNAHAEGRNTIALGEEQFVFGRFNEPDESGQYAELVGTGEGGMRKNGRTLDWNGNEWLSGSLSAAGLILRDESGVSYRIRVQSGALRCTRIED